MPSRPRRAVPPARRTVVALTVLAVAVGSAAWTTEASSAVDEGPSTGTSATPSATPTASPSPSPSQLPALPTLPVDPPTAVPESSSSPSSAPSPAASPIPVVPAPPPDRVDRRWPRREPWDACPRPVWPGQLSVGEPGAGRRVLVIGDSLTRDSRVRTAALMRSSGWTPTFRCWGSRRLDWGIAQVQRSRQLRQLPGFVVMALGTNDISWETPATTERRVRTLLRQLGPSRQVLWVDLDVDHSAFSRSRALWFNGMIRRLAAERENLTVLPWRRIARAERVGRFDGIHYGAAGYRLRARTVAAALDRLGRTVPAARP